jgi:hypothetical protein
MGEKMSDFILAVEKETAKKADVEKMGEDLNKKIDAKANKSVT